MAQWVEALRYKPEGGGFDSPMGSLEFFIGAMALGSTQPLTEMSRGKLKCDGTRAETRFRISGETDESI